MIARKIALSLMLVCGLACSAPAAIVTFLNTPNQPSVDIPGNFEDAYVAATDAAGAEATHYYTLGTLVGMTQNFGKYHTIADGLTSPVLAVGAYTDDYEQIIEDYNEEMEPILEDISDNLDYLVAQASAGNWTHVEGAANGLFANFTSAAAANIYYRGLVEEVRDSIRADCLNHPNGPDISITEGDPSY